MQQSDIVPTPYTGTVHGDPRGSTPEISIKKKYQVYARPTKIEHPSMSTWTNKFYKHFVIENDKNIKSL
jgi:hypothetical protein